MKGNKLGDVISELRKAKNLTQKEFADKIGISDKSVSRWETGSNYPNIDMIYQISKFFNVSFYNLLEVRMADDNADDEVVDAIMNEFHNMHTKNSKRIKFVFIGALIITIILIVSLLFTNSYNKYKVYQVGVESSDIYVGNGFYVETKIKDTLYINNISFRDYMITDNDTIIIDLLYKKDNKDYIIQSYSDLSNIVFTNYEDNDVVTDNINDIYLRVTLINAKGEVKEYETKLKFTLDFTNNKIYIRENSEEIDKIQLNSPEKVKEILLENGFAETTESMLIKTEKKAKLIYRLINNKLSYNFEKDKKSYRLAYNFNLDILEAQIFDKDNVEIENYKYDVDNKKIVECNTGRCNSYEEVFQIFEEKVLYLFNK